MTGDRRAAVYHTPQLPLMLTSVESEAMRNELYGEERYGATVSVSELSIIDLNSGVNEEIVLGRNECE